MERINLNGESCIVFGQKELKDDIAAEEEMEEEEESEIDVTDIDSDDEEPTGAAANGVGQSGVTAPKPKKKTADAEDRSKDTAAATASNGKRQSGEQEGGSPSAEPSFSAFRRVPHRPAYSWDHSAPPLYPTLHLRASLELHATPFSPPLHHHAPAAASSPRESHSLIPPRESYIPFGIPSASTGFGLGAGPAGSYPFRPDPLTYLDPRFQPMHHQWMKHFAAAHDATADNCKKPAPRFDFGASATARSTTAAATTSTKRDHNDSGAVSEEDDVIAEKKSPASGRTKQDDSGLQSSPGSDGSGTVTSPSSRDCRQHRDEEAMTSLPAAVTATNAGIPASMLHYGRRLYSNAFSLDRFATPSTSAEIPLPPSMHLPFAPARLPPPPAPMMTSPFRPMEYMPELIGRPRDPAKPAAVKKYKCDICHKAFSRSNTLVTHKRIHTGEKPFKCEICSRAFRQPGNLTRHRLTHTTLKPYVCPKCSKSFNRASNLHTHMRTHANFKPFVCPYCGKGFQQKVDMKIHCYTHTGKVVTPQTTSHVDM